MLFNILLEMVIARANEGAEHLGADISGSIISNLHFAIDIATFAESGNDLLELVSNTNREGSRLGLHINASKTKTQCFSKLNQIVGLSINNVAVKQVDSFMYLGDKLTSSNNSSEDIARCICLATRVVRSLQTIWLSSSIVTNTKLLLYNSLALSVPLYNAETWCLKKKTSISCESLRLWYYAELPGAR